NRKMSYYVNPRPKNQSETYNPWVLRVLLLGITGVILFFFAVVALLAGYQFMIQGQIHTGVSPIYGVDVAGMTEQEAIFALREQPSYENDATFTFRYGAQEWQYDAANLGIAFDVEGTVHAAYNVGRDENW